MSTSTRVTPTERIRAQAKAQVEQYLRDRETGQTTSREFKKIIESIISTNYDGRTVIELLQNAHDAHSRDSRRWRAWLRGLRLRARHAQLS